MNISFWNQLNFMGHNNLRFITKYGPSSIISAEYSRRFLSRLTSNDSVKNTIIPAVSCLVESLSKLLTNFFSAVSKFRESHLLKQDVLLIAASHKNQMQIKSLLNHTIPLILMRRSVYLDLCDLQKCDREKLFCHSCRGREIVQLS